MFSMIQSLFKKSRGTGASLLVIQDRRMFKRLHDKSSANITKNQLIQQPSVAVKPKRTYTARTYSQRYRPQRDLNQELAVPGIQLIRTEQFIFQGQLKRGLKHGEGIMCINNGTFIVGSWNEDMLEGRALIVSALGGKLLGNFSHGKFSGWVISMFRRRAVKCFFFHDNQMQGEKLTYDRQQELWMCSKSSQRGKLDVITHVQRGVITQPPSFLQSQQLKQLLCRFIVNRQDFLQVERISRIAINQSTSYLGFTDEEGRPDGLGMISNLTEVYMGNYREGVLEHFGRICFQNGDIYHGGISRGAFWGEGVYYTPAKNTTQVLYADQNQSVVDRQFDGYVLVDVKNQIPNCVTHNNSNTGVKGSTFYQMLQDLEPYYLLTFVQNVAQKDNGKEKSVYTEYGHSQNGHNLSDLRQSPQIHQETPSSKKSRKPPEKWVKLTEKLQQGGMPPLLLQKPRQVDKREVKNKSSLMNRSGAKGRVNEEEFEKSKTYDNNEVVIEQKEKIVPQIKLARSSTLNKEPRSQQITNIRLRKSTIGHPNEGRKDTGEPVNSKERQPEAQSEDSQNSEALRAVFSQIRQHRKKIFY